MTDREGRAAYSGKERITIHPEALKRIDARIDAVSRAGLLAVPVMLWAVARGPGVDLPDDQAILFARYQLARWGAHNIVWILPGDGTYGGERAEKWRRIGRAVFAEDRTRLVAMHYGSQQFPTEDFRGEPWFDVAGYQSGHGIAEKNLRWLQTGPPAATWKKDPVIPFINMEPNYEGHTAYNTKVTIDDFPVRRAAWWSCLVAPTAGVTYGTMGIWWWSPRDVAEVPFDHPRAGTAPPWREALGLPGSTQMKHLRRFLDGLRWWRLRPAPELLAAQPGEAEAERFVAAARTVEGDRAVLYLPVGGEVALARVALPRGARAAWYDPRAGRFAGRPAAIAAGDGPATLKPPGTGDWVLLIAGAAP